MRSEQGSKLGSLVSLKIGGIELERMVKSTGRSSTEPGINPQHTHTQQFIMVSNSSSRGAKHLYEDIHAGRTPMHININILKNENVGGQE